MKWLRLTLVGLLIGSFAAPVQAWWQSIQQVGVSAGGGGCSDTNATAWAAAVVSAGGTVSGTQLTNVCNLITAYKNDGVYTLMDDEWLLASENAFTAKVSIVSPYASLTVVGTPTFAANSGYSAFSASNYLNTGRARVSGQASQNSITFGASVRGGRVALTTGIAMGAQADGIYSYFYPLTTSTMIGAENFGGTFATYASPSSIANGNFVLSRTSAANFTVYYQSGGTPTSHTITDTSGASATAVNYFIGCYNSGGTCTSPDSTTDIISSAFAGAGLTGTQAANKNADLCTYLTAVGATGC